MHEVLLLVEDEPVEAREEDHAKEDVGKVARRYGDKFHDEDGVESHHARATVPRPRLHAGPHGRERAQDSDRDLLARDK